MSNTPYTQAIAATRQLLKKITELEIEIGGKRYGRREVYPALWQKYVENIYADLCSESVAYLVTNAHGNRENGDTVDILGLSTPNQDEGY